ncbi:TatD family hydrolase [Blattabacterium cuenoti]|uniref:TatD family hydrolase n=1 Tax=Blattabacterium cuenoti TaxID=1653831 RepID=UPI00163C8532|nr:TatD family hydrolase [Blattabacterium cuenoti]
MKITDTHAHLYMNEFQKDYKLVIKKSLSQGIHRILLPSLNKNSIIKILKLKKNFPTICFPMIGLHPNYINSDNLKIELNNIMNCIEKHYIISIGEIGIDLHLSKKFFFEQKYAFQIQIKWAKEHNIPIVIHCRNAFNYVFDILSKENNPNLKGVFHCFNGTLEQAKKIVDLGMKLGIGGIVTFKKNNLVPFLHKIKLNNILLETDSPYLSPHPLRGKRNNPSNLRIILKVLSKIYSLSEEKMAITIEKNVNELFFDNSKIKSS